MPKKCKRKVKIFSLDKYDLEGNLELIIARLQNYYNQLIVNFESIEIILEEEIGYYDERYISYVGYGIRDETEAEERKRIEAEKKSKQERGKRERAQYEKLKKKYG